MPLAFVALLYILGVLLKQHRKLKRKKKTNQGNEETFYYVYLKYNKKDNM